MQERKRLLRGPTRQQRPDECHQGNFQKQHLLRSKRWAACTAALAFIAAVLAAAPAQAVVGYHVVVGSLGANARTGPGTGFAVAGKLYNGQAIDIACQTKGTLVGVGLPGTPTDVWDRLTNGWYITDYYTSTTGLNGSYTPGIPQCGATVPPPPTPAPPAPPVSTQPADGCAQVRVVAARGSGQNPFSDDNGMGGEVKTFFTTLQSLLPGVDVRYWADPYPAVNVLNVAYAPEYKGSPYIQSVQYGELFADRYVYDHLHGCPSEHLILAGYSQGADVMHSVWNNVAGNGGLDTWRGRLDGLVLFADARFDASQRTSIPANSLDIGTFTRSGHGGIFGADAVVWGPQQETAHFMHSYCRGGDPVCDYFGWNISIHKSYVAAGIPQSTGQALSRWLVGHYFH